MPRKITLSPKTKAAQKKLFEELSERYTSLKQISEILDTNYSNVWAASNLARPLCPFFVVKLCLMADGKVKPHEVRPDIFDPKIAELYR